MGIGVGLAAVVLLVGLAYFQHAASDRLRQALKTSTLPADLQALKEGLAGPPSKRDPELEPLRESPEFRAFVREVQSS